MNLSEGEYVVTPEGSIIEGHGRRFGGTIKTDSPLRIRVDHEADARALISRAEGAGFRWYGEDGRSIDFDPNDQGVEFFPSTKEMMLISVHKCDLAYPSDSDQILGWLDFHSEECDTCGGTGKAREKAVRGKLHKILVHDSIPCPDCSEDDEQWESPDPSDPAWREAFLEREKTDGDIASTRETGLALGIDSYSEAIADIFDYIDRLEDFSETMREWGILNRDGAKELKEKVQTLEAERDELRGLLERILKMCKRESLYSNLANLIGPLIERELQILDGEGESQ